MSSTVNNFAWNDAESTRCSASSHGNGYMARPSNGYVGYVRDEWGNLIHTDYLTEEEKERYVKRMWF